MKKRKKRPTQRQAADRKKKFIAAYLVSGNATEAARQAGYKGSQGSMETRGSQLLRDPQVEAELAAAQAQVMEEAGVDALSIVRELVKLGYSDMGRFLDIDDKGNASLNFTKIREGDTACISEFSQEESRVGKGEYYVRKTKIKLHNKEGPLRLLGARLKQWDGVESKERVIERWVIAIPVEQASGLPIKRIGSGA